MYSDLEPTADTFELENKRVEEFREEHKMSLDINNSNSAEKEEEIKINYDASKHQEEKENEEG